MSVSFLGYQQITSLSSATALTVPAGTEYAIIQCESQAVRWRGDGATTSPTASVGMRLTTSGELRLEEQLTRVKFIEEAASAKLNISYYGLYPPTP